MDGYLVQVGLSCAMDGYLVPMGCRYDGIHIVPSELCRGWLCPVMVAIMMEYT